MPPGESVLPGWPRPLLDCVQTIQRDREMGEELALRGLFSSSSYKGAVLSDHGPTLMSSSNLSPSYRPGLEMHSHWGLGLQHILLGGYKHSVYHSSLIQQFHLSCIIHPSARAKHLGNITSYSLPDTLYIHSSSKSYWLNIKLHPNSHH